MTDINIGQLAEAINDKTDRDLMNVDTSAGADAVIEYQLPTAENNYTWYRKYKSGWVEQGGIYEISIAAYDIFNLLVTMANSHYTITGNSLGQTTQAYALVFDESSNTTTTFRAKTGIDSSGKFSWRVEGMAA